MAQEKDYVLFENSHGDVVSNDPRWQAERTLQSDGVDINAMKRELEELRAFRDSQMITPGAPGVQETSSETEDDDSNAEGEYAEVTGQALVDLAKKRGIDLKNADGSKKRAAEVRAELAAQDESNK